MFLLEYLITKKTISISAPINNSYIHSDIELETMQLINEYRVSVGLNNLDIIPYISLKCEEHNNNMISMNIVSHNGNVARFDDIIKVLGCTNVGENVAYNYTTPKSVLNAWLLSVHKANVEGKFTHMGLSIRKNENDKNYYTNIFIKNII
jgi:uncharacterized protein YkwD